MLFFILFFYFPFYIIKRTPKIQTQSNEESIFRNWSHISSEQTINLHIFSLITLTHINIKFSTNELNLKFLSKINFS